ncbi:MAG: hypothetical protein JNK32_12345 [Anaerolineales bacterium]|nr:hypothetical protein [Anaerolineales bacterium]
MQFKATYVDSYTNSTTANVMFADPETNPDQPFVLSFSRPIEPGFEDSAYYFEINDQSYGSYGGLTLVRLSRNSIEIKVEPYVVEKFEVEDFAEASVQFEVDEKKYQDILENMRRIFKGFSEYQEV